MQISEVGMTINMKRLAAEAAVSAVTPGMQLGLGTGSTVAEFLTVLAHADLGVMGMPTSEATAARCRELGIGLLQPGDVHRLDLTIDGADELDHDLRATKGGGGALLREKVVASISERMIVIATTDKLVGRLADTFALPIEVVPFAEPIVTYRLEQLGFLVSVRTTSAGERVLTDNQNLVLDARFPGGISDPAGVDMEVGMIPGVVTTGLFIDLVSEAYLAAPDGSVTHLVAS
jgi:ribose 5-phosphate isomerase A